MSATLRDDAVHLLEVELAAGRVELVDLRRHPDELVLGPAQPAEPAAVAVLLVGRHLGGRRTPRTPPAPLASPCSNAFSTLGSRPSRIFFTSASVAAKIPWILAVTSARLASSFDLVLPLSATSLASAAPLAPCMPATPAVVSAAASALPCAITCLLLLAELAGRRVGVRGGGLLVGERLLELRLVRLGQLLLADLGVGHLLVGLVLAGREVELLGRRRLRAPRPRPGSGPPGPAAPAPIGVTGLGTALDWSGRRLGGGLDVLGLPLLALGHQALDLALDLAGLAGLLVVVGLLRGSSATSPRSPPSPRR